MMNKAILFIAMVCILMMGATANVDYIISYTQPKNPINIDGMNGKIGLTPFQYVSNTQAKVIPTSFEEAYQQRCDAIRQYQFNNPGMGIGRKYRIINCVLEHKEITYIASPSKHQQRLIQKITWTPVQI